MKADELLRQAWDAVQKAGVPEPLHEVAFSEAVDFLRHGETDGDTGDTKQDQQKKKVKRTAQEPEAGSDDGPVDEASLFSELSDESGVSEQDLRDVLNVKGSEVQVIQRAKDLGNSAAVQARTVIALVAGARAKGLGERPVDTETVRKELRRKHIYSSGNFAAQHLGRLKGFNPGSTSEEILLNTHWLAEFKAAVEQARGQQPPDNKS